MFSSFCRHIPFKGNFFLLSLVFLTNLLYNFRWGVGVEWGWEETSEGFDGGDAGLGQSFRPEAKYDYPAPCGVTKTRSQV